MTQRKFGLLSSSVIYGIGGAAQRLVGFLLLPWMTRYLTPADYGVVGLLAVLPALLMPVFTFGLGASVGVCYFAAEDPMRRQSVMHTARWMSYVSAGLMTALALADLSWFNWVAVGSLNYRTHTLIAIVTAALSVLCLPLQLEQQFTGRPIEFVFVSIAGAVVTSIGSLLLIAFFHMGALGVLLGSLLGQSLVWVLLLVQRRVAKAGDGHWDWALAKELLVHGMPMLPSFALLFILQNGIRWPLEWTHGVGAVGLFTIGSSFGTALSLFTAGFVAAWMPWALGQREQWEQARHMVARRLTQYLIGGGLLVVLFFCLAQPALGLMTAPSYFEAWVVVGLSSAASFLMSVFSLLLPPVYIAKKVALVLVSQAAAVVAAVAATYLLIDFGILGAALSVFIGTLALVGAQVIVNARLTGVQPIPFEKGRLVAAGLLTGLACWATFGLRLAEVGEFILHALLLVLLVGGVLVKLLPDRQTLLRKLLRGLL